MCNNNTRYIYTICGKRLCLFNKKKWTTKCFSAYHNDNCFGLSRSDSLLHGEKVSKWKPSTNAKINLNARRVADIKADIEDEEQAGQQFIV